MRLGRWNYARLRNAAFHHAVTIWLNQCVAEEVARVGKSGDSGGCACPIVQTGDGGRALVGFDEPFDGCSCYDQGACVDLSCNGGLSRHCAIRSTSFSSVRGFSTRAENPASSARFSRSC